MNRNIVEWIARPASPMEEEPVAGADGFVVDEAAGVDAELDAERWDGLS